MLTLNRNRTMRTLNDLIAGYAGCRFTPAEWARVFDDDARILRENGSFYEARLVDLLARRYAARGTVMA